MKPSPVHFRRRAQTAAGVLSLATIVALAFVVDLGRPDFWDPGESRYAETVREMLASGNWLQPTLNGTRYYDKPPGYFWVVAAAFRVLGRHEWAARAPSAVAAALTIACTVAFAWRRTGVRAALGSGVVLATAAQFVALGRTVRMDMLLTLLTTGTLLHAFMLWEHRDDARDAPRPVTWPLYVLPAAGLLVKGPIAAVVPAMVVLAFLAATRTPIRLRHLRPGPGALVALGLVAAAYAALAIRSPDYLWTFLWQHNLGRFFGRALAGHREPAWYYAWILPVTFLPWALFLPGALAQATRRARRGHGLPIFLLLWCAVPFVFFSVSRAKLATYLLPIFPALSILVALHLDRAIRAAPGVGRRLLRVPLLAWTGTLAVAALGTPIGVAVAFPGYGRRAVPVVALALFAPLAWWVARSERWRAVPALVATAALATALFFYRAGAPVVNEFASLRAAAEIARELPADAHVFAYKVRGHSFTYYGERVVLRVRSPAAAAAALARSAPTAVLVKARHLDEIRTHLERPACVWWRGPAGRALLANLPSPPPSVGFRLDPSGGSGPAERAPTGTPPPC